MEKVKTFAIIKPDAVKNNHTHDILSMIKSHNFDICKMEHKVLTKNKVQGFYAEHNGKPFFDDLVQFMTSDICILLELEGGPNAILDWRDLMGSTDPAQAAEGTIRNKFAESVGKKAVHGSDSAEAAQRELKYFFG